MYDPNPCPCKDCEERYLGCHSKCNRYIKWKQKHDQRCKEYNKKLGFEKDLIGYDIQNNTYFKKRNKWGKRGSGK